MRRLAVLLLTAALLTGCSGLLGDRDGRSEVDRYVALGDSYTAGSGMLEPVAEAGGCAQSRLAYPRLVAAELGARLVDASCGSASSENALVPQPRPDGTTWPPQLDRVDADTDLVTVGLGYNDLGFFSRVLGCTSMAAQDPGGAPCRAAGPDLTELPARIGDRVARLVDTVRAAAPDAEVLVVGYPQLVPAAGGCAGLSLAAGDQAFVRGLLEELDAALREAARAAGAGYVDVLGPSEGHDPCAGEDAWLTGAAGTPDQRAPFHPRPAGQRAVAELVLEALGR